MNEPSLADRLIGGDRRSVGVADTIASEVLRHNERFGELFEAMLHEDAVVRVRASDAVEMLTRSRPDLLVPFRKRLIDEIGESDQKEIRRHVGQMLARVRLDPKERSRAIALLERYIRDEDSAVTGPAMSALGDFAMEDAHLRRRLAPKIEKLMLSSPALAARGKKILMRFAALTKPLPRR